MQLGGFMLSTVCQHHPRTSEPGSVRNHRKGRVPPGRRGTGCAAHASPTAPLIGCDELIRAAPNIDVGGKQMTQPSINTTHQTTRIAGSRATTVWCSACQPFLIAPFYQAAGPLASGCCTSDSGRRLMAMPAQSRPFERYELVIQGAQA